MVMHNAAATPATQKQELTDTSEQGQKCLLTYDPLVHRLGSCMYVHMYMYIVHTSGSLISHFV